MEHGEHRTNNPSVSPKASPGQVRRLLTLKEAAAVLGTSSATLRRLIWTGKLPAVRLTRRIQVDLRDLERLIDAAKDRRR